jgi:hypothetical protein
MQVLSLVAKEDADPQKLALVNFVTPVRSVLTCPCAVLLEMSVFERLIGAIAFQKVAQRWRGTSIRLTGRLPHPRSHLNKSTRQTVRVLCR